MLNIAEVYPARLGKSKIRRLEKLEIYSTLILLVYISYNFNGSRRCLTFLYLKLVIFRVFFLNNKYVGLSGYFVSSLWKLL